MTNWSIEVTHRGYTARQSGYNHHVWIEKDGEFVAHIHKDKQLTEEELRSLVDNHIKLCEKLGI